MLKRTLTTALTAAGLLAGGVTMATPASADSTYVPWDTNFVVNVNTSNFQWSPQLQYTFGVEVPQFTQCPGGWGPNQNTGDNYEQICRFQLKTSANYRDVTIRILPGSVITDPKTGNTITVNDVGNGIAFPAIPYTTPPRDGETFTPILYFDNVDPSTVPQELRAGIEYVNGMTSGAPEAHLWINSWLFNSYSQTAMEAPVGSAVDVRTEAALGDDTSGDVTVNPNDIVNPLDAPADDAPTDNDGAQLGARSKTLTTGDHQVVKEHHTRVEKMAAKVHNQGGVLTIHAYGPDEGLALARALAVRKHLEAQLAKRGHIGSSPIWVTYAGDPDHKKGVQATVHHHPGTTLPGALPGVK